LVRQGQRSGAGSANTTVNDKKKGSNAHFLPSKS
jgi:hypothetical protein